MASAIYDIETLRAAGIDPKVLIKANRFYKEDIPCEVTKANIKRFLRIIDEQNAVNRYTWYNLPCNISSQELERLLYYKGQLVFFYYPDQDKFYFMPYALDGSIDFYGRYNSVHPVPMTSGQEGDKKYKALEDLLSTIVLDIKYELQDEDSIDEDTINKSGVILRDYTNQLGQIIIPRQTVNETILDAMSECVPYMLTSLLNGTGVKGVRVNDADQAESVKEGARGVKRAALSGVPWIPVTGPVEFQELTDGNLLKSSEYMLAMQSLDNLRLSSYGLENGGLFEKKAHVNDTEMALNQTAIGSVEADGLAIRQNFCNIINSIWNCGTWVEVSENSTGIDNDGDGKAYEENMGGENSGIETGGDFND